MDVKAMSSMIAAPLILLAAIFAVISTDVTFIWEARTVEEANVQATVYTMWNALQAADLYDSISIDYSIYQACYDILKRGGFKEEGKYWSNSEDETEKPPTEEEFKTEFQELVQEYLNRYTLNDYDFFEIYRNMVDISQKSNLGNFL